MTRANRVEAKAAPNARPLREYMEGNAFVGSIVQLVLAVLVGALATSRADGHLLTPWTLAAVVAASSAAGVVVGWPVAVYGGASDALRGLVVVGDRDAHDGRADELSPGRLWRAAAGWAGAAALWSLAAAVLVVVVLDGRHANAVVTIAALAALGGVSGRAVDLIGRRRGIEMARASITGGPRVPVRRRAWLHVALPVAFGQGLVNAGASWLLFRDYTQGDPFAEHALTEQAVIAEVATIVVLMVAIFAPMIRTWGEVDATLGRVTVDGDTTAPIGPQAFVYIVVAAFLLGPATGWLLPAAPSLVRVVTVRSLLAFAVVLLVAGLAHVRGAVNATAVAA